MMSRRGKKKTNEERPQLPEKLSRASVFSSSSSEALPDPVHGVGGRYSNASDIFNGVLLTGTSYRVGQRIGGGNFGEIRIVRDIKTNHRLAVKLEPESVQPSQLANEWEIYTALNKTPAVGIPKVFHYGTCGMHSALVLELLGPSLEQIFRLCDRKFSLHTILMIAVQLIDRLEHVHSCRIINLDVKPENFLICKPPNRDTTIFITDFGLGKYYIDPAIEAHEIPLRVKDFIGTPRYASLNIHMGLEQSPRDDLESLGYSLIYFLRGSLPWNGQESKTGSSAGLFSQIFDLKKNIDLRELCKGEMELVEYMHYVRNLKFEQIADYDYLRQLFRRRMQKEKLNPAGEMDWTSKVADKARMRQLQRLNS